MDSPQSRLGDLAPGRILARIDFDGPGGCWLWTGARWSSGYGITSWEGRRQVAVHRLVYSLLVGPIPDGLILDHTCHNADLTCDGGGPAGCLHRRCCNPAHLEAVTHGTNTKRGATIVAGFIRQTECVHGHDLTDRSNLKPHKSGGRICRACANDDRRRRYHRRRAAGMSAVEAQNGLRH